jgi:DNA-binding SARP family transcriptional activator
MRCHLLASLVEDLGAEAARDWHRRAADLLRREGASAEAARAYARAEDWPMAREMLDRIGVGIVADDLEPWRELFPDALVAGDPWQMLAEGRHLLAQGRLHPAVQCLERAEALFSDESGKAHCRRTISRVRIWLPGPTRGFGDWAAWLRAATQRHPELIAVQAERLGGDRGRMVRAVAGLLAGTAIPVDGPAGEAEEPGSGLDGALRLCRLVVGVVQGDRPASPGLPDLAAELAPRYPWLARMARLGTALEPTAAGLKLARQIAEECDRDEDEWGAALACGVALWTADRTGMIDVDADLSAAEELVARCRRLDAGVLEAWARVVEARIRRAAGLADADEQLRAASAFARSAGVPGAMALAEERSAAAVVPRLKPAVDDTVAAPIAVWCLGGFRLRLAGRPLALETVKPRVRTLLRLLAMHAPGAVHREVLAEALWPDAPPQVAGHSLHVALSSLRQLLEPGAARGRCRWLAREGEAYRLVIPEDGFSDVTLLREALHSVRRVRDDAESVELLHGVLNAYTGDLLPEEGAADWVVAERDRLRRAVAEAALSLAGLEFGRGEMSAAAVAAGRCIAVDRYHDAGWRLLIRVLNAQGAHAAARDAQARYDRLLAELGLSGPHRPGSRLSLMD